MQDDAEDTRTGVFVCGCGKNIAGFLDVAAVADYAGNLPGVACSATFPFACSEDAQRRIREAISTQGLSRVVVAACSPITHGPVFQQTCAEAGLNPHLIEMANIRNQCSWVHSDRHDLATTKAQDLVRMAVAKSGLLQPLPTQEIDVTKRCLVIGGGVAGISAALALADMGIETCLVEREPALGGKLRQLATLAPSGESASAVLERLLAELRRRRNIQVFTNSELRAVDGYVGNFEVELASRGDGLVERLAVGTMIVATGFQEADLSGRYGYGQHPAIMTQLELEQRLKAGSVGAPRTAVIINCAGSLEPANPGCCRIGCGIAVKNATQLQRVSPNTRIIMLYQDLRLFGRRQEEQYSQLLEQARPTMVRYGAEQPPRVELRNGQIMVMVYDTLLRQELAIEADMLVLTAALRGDEQTPRLKQLLKVAASAENFYNEAHAKIRPLDFASDGIFLCGSAHYPRTIPDTIAQAQGAASRAAIPILRGTVTVEPVIAELDAARCSGCGICTPLCPYGALSLDLSQNVAAIAEALCKGCGTCVAACPSGALQQRGFNDQQLLAMIDAAWE